MASRVVYIYDLADPETGEVRYIGKSVDPKERLATHIREARNGNVLHSRRWIDGILKSGRRPVMSILEEVKYEDANEAERYWIAAFRIMDARLTNRTDGGDGQSLGYKPNKESVERAAAKIRGVKRSEEARERLRVAFNKPEIRAARRERQLRRMADPELRAIAQRGRSGMPTTEETKMKIAASWTPERKAAHAKEKSALEVDDRWRSQLRAALQSRWDKYRASKGST